MADVRHVMTDQGFALKGKHEVGRGTPNVTRVVMGAGFVDEALLEQQTDVTDPIGEMEVGIRELVDGKVVRLPVQYSNINTTESKNVHQLGVYSEDPDEGEILYQLVQYSTAVSIPSYIQNRGGVILFAPEIDIWFTNAETVSAPPTPGFLLTLDEFLKTQPTEEIATIQHNLGILPICILYEGNHAAGAGGYGESGYGGSTLESIPVKLEPQSSNVVKVFTVPRHAGSPQVSKLADDRYALVYPDSTKSLTLILR